MCYVNREGGKRTNTQGGREEKKQTHTAHIPDTKDALHTDHGEQHPATVVHESGDAPLELRLPALRLPALKTLKMLEKMKFKSLLIDHGQRVLQIHRVTFNL